MKAILWVVTMFSIPLLAGCIDLELTICEDNGGECGVLNDLYVFVECKDASEGYFSGAVMRGLGQGHYPLCPLLLGADPLTMDMGYVCNVYASFDFDCGRVYIPPGATSASGTIERGLSIQCSEPL